MQWSLKALTAFTHHRHNSSPSPSRTVREEKRRSTPLQDLSNNPNVPLSPPEFTQGSSSQRCHCGYQPADFCPYCDHQEAVQSTVVLNVVELSPPSDIHSFPSVAASEVLSDPTSRRRKLRKVKPDYQQIRLQSSTDTQNVSITNSPKPESLQSTNSRTPLLKPFARVSAHYPPLPEEPRTPKKLEKRDKRRRSRSITGFYTTRFGISSAGNSETNLRTPLSAQSAQRPKSAYESGPTFSQGSGSLGTDALVSLAWTGEIQKPLATSEESLEPTTQPESGVNPFDTPPTPHTVPESVPEHRPRIRRKSDSSSQNRNSFFRRSSRFADAQEVPLPPPWNLAKALTDDSLSDEKLVGHLEDMRIKEDARPTSLFSFISEPPNYLYVLNESYAEYPIEPGELISEPSSPIDSSWNSARQALLLCREMIRTERRYQASLKTLVKGGTATCPPVSMLLYLPALIRASDAFLQSMTLNPSVQGVSEAFINTQQQMDDAFSRWCAVVGVFFFAVEETTTGSSNLRSDSEDASDISRSGSGSRPSRSASKQSLRSQSVDSNLNDIKLEPNKIRRNTRGRPSVRELAILPTQRIVRYVLLFKELLALMSPSRSSYGSVEQAVHAAQAIARKADDAQKYSSVRVPQPPF
ncbi:hypothetical protein CPB83DRAFT_891447 [Crepidotus variabilis]|uniref:DH domain-containing protein n=1 Tax=Crepidotus variabilis TaxID=179855 RepID=A0A9P6ENN8_9AGAR|nr:hypothetical protein CPB83DRAFT_891447 [Crepidotus variabilis]